MTDISAILEDARPDSELTHEEILERNLRVVAGHFHNENPEDVDKAIALYADQVVWEGPFRGVVLTDPADVKEAYLGIFRTVKINKIIQLRRFATEQFVFDDQINELEIVGQDMPNLDLPIGTQVSLRLVHCFELRDGRITREIAYELMRERGGPRDHDFVPEGSRVEVFDSAAV